MPELIKIFNRPLSPHLTIYSSQFTSVFSIWHRITGVILIIIFVLSLYALKFYSVSTLNYFLNYVLISNLWLQNALFINLIIFFIYHMLNGIRHILWDLGYTLPVKIIQASVRLLGITVFLSTSILIYKIIN